MPSEVWFVMRVDVLLFVLTEENTGAVADVTVVAVVAKVIALFLLLSLAVSYKKEEVEVLWVAGRRSRVNYVKA